MSGSNPANTFDTAIEQQKMMLENQRIFFEMQRNQIAAINDLALATARNNIEMVKMFAAACADITAKAVHAKPEILADILNQVHEFAKSKGFVQ